MWWNSVRIRWDSKDTPTAVIYKDCNDNSYSVDDLEHNPLGEKVLDLKVQVDNYYEEDADGYPIIFVDEIHTLKKEVQTILLSILTDFHVSFIDENGKDSSFEIPPFTLIVFSTT